MRIVVVGVGALGSLFGGALSAKGHDVSLLIRNNAHRAAIRANGLQMYLDSGDLVVHPKIIDAESLNSESGDSGSSGESEPADLIIVFTKTGATHAALTGAMPLIGPETRLVSLQNGLGNKQRLAEFVPESRIIYGTTMAPADVSEAGVVESHGPHLSQFRAATDDDPVTSAMAARFAEILDAAAIPAVVNDTVDQVIWGKVAFNCALSSICTVIDNGPGLIADHPDLAALADAVAMEVCDVADADGVPMDRQAVRDGIDMAGRKHRGHTPSMLRDARAERLTEIDSLNGAVVEIGAANGVPTPRNATLLALVRAREASYGQGKN